MKQRIIFLLNFGWIILFFVIHCQKNSTGSLKNGITIQTTDHFIVINNHNDSPVYFLAVERRTALLIDWYPACEVDAPNRIDPKKSIEIEYKDIHGYYENCEIIIYWWFCIKKYGEDHLSFDKIRSEVVQTK
jgi:hypothetical protein